MMDIQKGNALVPISDVYINGKDYLTYVQKAVKGFWTTKKKQLSVSGDSTNRGAVVGGKQMDGFISLLCRIAKDAGVPAKCIITDKNYLPGYFRSSKDWDMLIIAPSGKLVAAIELKSQVGSYGNNLNNRLKRQLVRPLTFGRHSAKGSSQISKHPGWAGLWW